MYFFSIDLMRKLGILFFFQMENAKKLKTQLIDRLCVAEFYFVGYNSYGSKRPHDQRFRIVADICIEPIDLPGVNAPGPPAPPLASISRFHT